MGCPRFPQKGEKGQGYPQSIQDDSTKRCGKISLYRGETFFLGKGEHRQDEGGGEAVFPKGRCLTIPLNPFKNTLVRQIRP